MMAATDFHSDSHWWEDIPLEKMTVEQWEALCDGCGKCCLHKLEDIETGRFYYSNVACRLMDINTCRCTNYENRSKEITECLKLTPETVKKYLWLPKTCAYRRLANRKRLPNWHPLISGDVNLVHKMGISIRGKVIREQDIDLDKLDRYIVNARW